MEAASKLQNCYNELAATFPAYVQDTLLKIDNINRQLLALRRYVRKSRDIAKQWSWSSTQITDYLASEQYRTVRDKITAVKRTFESQNPGYSLAVSPIRNIPKQVNKWNHNDSVGLAAEDLMAKCLGEMENYPDLTDHTTLADFKHYLERSHVTPEPTSAAPGLSDHGKMNAIDFVIVQGHKTIAGTESKSISRIWKRLGWADKLKAAIEASNTGFTGPLPHPYEPWHYTLPH